MLVPLDQRNLAPTMNAIGAELDRAALGALADSFQGHLVGQSDSDYDDWRKIWNASIDRRPALIARCAGVADVIAAVRFAREQGLLVAVRSGGHNYRGCRSAMRGS